jgi:hypothetical protein
MPRFGIRAGGCSVCGPARQVSMLYVYDPILCLYVTSHSIDNTVEKPSQYLWCRSSLVDIVFGKKTPLLGSVVEEFAGLYDVRGGTPSQDR